MGVWSMSITSDRTRRLINLVINQGEALHLPHKSKIIMKQTINLDVAAKKLAKVNSLLNEVNNTLQDLLVNVQELDNDYSNKSFDLCQSYCQLADEIGAAIMQEKVLEVLDKKQS